MKRFQMITEADARVLDVPAPVTTTSSRWSGLRGSTKSSARIASPTIAAPKIAGYTLAGAAVAWRNPVPAQTFTPCGSPARTAVSDSTVICEYLEERYPSPSLLPKAIALSSMGWQVAKGVVDEVLGQEGQDRGDRRAGRHVGEALDRQGGTPDRQIGRAHV